MENGYRKSLNIRFHLDPRTKLLLLILFSVVVMIDVTDGPAYIVRAIMTYIPVVLVCLEGKPHVGARFTVLFILATWLMEITQENIGGIAGMLILFLCYMITQFAPTMIMVWYCISTTKISEFMAAMNRMRLPQGLAISIAVMMRFFPTLSEEYRSIRDAMRTDITLQDTNIVFDNVDFSYSTRKILDHVSFSIPEKTTTAIVGPSGAGKTTMCNLIARFWDVNAGKITIGGTDVRDFKLDSLMKNISMVFQSVYLFADTIENNIKFGCPDATHEQVVEAAKKACCHDFISALPEGYDTVIGEGGGTLSGGEKQRISIARAMLKNAPIIILDEATSSVDPENEDELQRAIEALTHDKTIIMIAHRLKTVRNADQIIVLDNAHIVQRGTHAELIRQKGLYADFVLARQEAIGWKLG